MQEVYKADTKNLSLASKLLFLFVGYSLLAVSFTPSFVMAKDSVAVIRVATASNFLLPLKFLRVNFEQNTPYKLKISSASTAKLYAQILNGAPYDIFLAADNVVTKKLVLKGKALAKNEFMYAQGRLVLWSTREKFKTVNLLKSGFIQGNFKRLALANPKTAPYGRAAMEVMNFYKMNPKRRQLVFGESVGQAFQFIGSGNVDMGFVAYSQVKAQLMSQSSSFVSQTKNYWLLPSDSYNPIYQHGVLLSRRDKKLKEGAVAFAAYLKSDEVRKVLQDKFGYDVAL